MFAATGVGVVGVSLPPQPASVRTAIVSTQVLTLVQIFDFNFQSSGEFRDVSSGCEEATRFAGRSGWGFVRGYATGWRISTRKCAQVIVRQA